VDVSSETQPRARVLSATTGRLICTRCGQEGHVAASCPVKLPPRKSGGIRTIEDIRQRCHVEADTGCWIWRGYASKDMSPHPVMRLAALGICVSAGAAISLITRGERSTPAKVMYAHCGNSLCCNPAHRRSGGKKAAMKVAGQTGRPKPADVVAKMTRAARARSPFTADDVSDIRALQGKEPARNVAARFNVCTATICRIWKGQNWRTATTGSSVFNWR
jgi:hypothetical protein